MSGPSFVDARSSTPSRQPQPRRIQTSMGTRIDLSIVTLSSVWFLIIVLSFSQSASHSGQACSDFQAWCMAHKGKATSDVTFNLEDPPEAYTNPSVHSRISEYTEVARTPTNDASGPSPQSQCPRWVHVVFFTFVVHLVMDLWYTCDALVDFDGLVDLFGWTWALIIIYVIYIVMDVIWADGCVDGWDIYMRWMRYICDG